LDSLLTGGIYFRKPFNINKRDAPCKFKNRKLTPRRGDVFCSLPGDASGFHVVGEGDVVAPHVELPLSQAQDAAKHVSGVDADPHVHVESGGFPDEPATRK
jgi:hypothetical protein